MKGSPLNVSKCALALLCVLPRLVVGGEQHRVGVEVVKDLPPGDSEGTAAIEHSLNAARKATGRTSAYTDTALATALGTARSLFTTEIPPPSRVATLTENDEDVLVANFSAPRLRTTLHPVLLWDGAVSGDHHLRMRRSPDPFAAPPTEVD